MATEDIAGVQGGTISPPWPEGEAIDMPQPNTTRSATSWRSTPQREFLRCLTAALFKERGLRETALARAFKDLVPDYERHLHGVTAKAIGGKGRNCWYYPRENPENDPRARPYYELAKEVVRRSRKVDVDEVLRHLGKTLPAAAIEPVKAEEEEKEAAAEKNHAGA